ncbi:MAG: FAD-binding oxidoreductase [Pseudomonadota bacterium]
MNIQNHTHPTSDMIEKFKTLIGDEHVITDSKDMSQYLTEWRDLYQGKASCILLPGSTQDVSHILSYAHEMNIAIVPQGGNTGLVGGQIPFESGHEVIINLSRMNSIRNIDTAGNTMTVEAGAILQNIQDAADNAERLFPLSLAAEGSCQIGGNLATNAGGVGVLAYGNARNLVLGLEVVLADGQIWNGLRALTKDNTGYNLKDLFIGSEGTLGIITTAVLKLFPKPAEQSTAFLGAQSLQDVAHLFSLASQIAGHQLTAFELLPRVGIEMVTKHIQEARDPLETPQPWYVLLEISSGQATGNASELTEKILETALENNYIHDGALALTISQAKDFWRLREAMSEVQREEGGSIKHDISVPIARIPEFIKRANDAVETMIPGSRPVPFGHYGDGNIHYNVSQPTAMDKSAFLAQWDMMAEAVHSIVLDLEGSISAEHGIGRMKKDLLKDVKSPVELDLMQSIKKTFDPKGILNPGKLI